MHSRLGQIIKLEVFGRSKLIEHCKNLYSKTKTFFSAITLPDNSLPLIGDTRAKNKGFLRNTASGFEVFDYSKSGYVIAKGLSDSGEPFHFVFKNAHQSRMHRHDDDLSFHLYFNGAVVFADGGTYSYIERDPIRQFLRSTYSHNTVFPLHKKMVRLPEELKRKPVCQLPKPREVRGISAASGRGLTRSIDFSKLAAGELTIRDQYVSIRRRWWLIFLCRPVNLPASGANHALWILKVAALAFYQRRPSMLTACTRGLVIMAKSMR